MATLETVNNMVHAAMEARLKLNEYEETDAYYLAERIEEAANWLRVCSNDACSSHEENKRLALDLVEHIIHFIERDMNRGEE